MSHILKLQDGIRHLYWDGHYWSYRRDRAVEYATEDHAKAALRSLVTIEEATDGKAGFLREPKQLAEDQQGQRQSDDQAGYENI